MEDDLLDFDSKSIIDNYEDEIDVSQSKLENKSLEIQQLISHFEYRLLGFNWKANGEKFIWSGRALVGDDTAQKIMLLLHPFSKEVIMIGNKKNFTFQKQLLRTRLELASIITKAVDVDSKDFKDIWRSFSNLLINIGDIILDKNSRSFLEGYFGVGDDYKKDSDYFFGKRKREGDLYE